MAQSLWGHVYFHEHLAGMLRQEEGEHCSFTYDPAYLAAGHPAIAWSLPLQVQPHISQHGLHPFFDNLAAEGWLEAAQTFLLGKWETSRLDLLLAFGEDCAGAVSVRDADGILPGAACADGRDPLELAVLDGRASVGGVQTKIAVIRSHGTFRPASRGRLSTHIAKFSPPDRPDMIFNEYLTMRAFQALLPEEPVVQVHIGDVAGIPRPALLVPRFDRTADGGRIHFEEFNQLLRRPSAAKYDGSYRDMADFIRATAGCQLVDIETLFRRVLAGLLLGNTDMHLKNFAMLHTPDGLRLAPSYDQVATALYGYEKVALGIGDRMNCMWTRLTARSWMRLGAEFGLSSEAVQAAFESLACHKDAALAAIFDDAVAPVLVRNKLVGLVAKRWQASFSELGAAVCKTT